MKTTTKDGKEFMIEMNVRELERLIDVIWHAWQGIPLSPQGNVFADILHVAFWGYNHQFWYLGVKEQDVFGEYVRLETEFERPLKGCSCGETEFLVRDMIGKSVTINVPFHDEKSETFIGSVTVEFLTCKRCKKEHIVSRVTGPDSLIDHVKKRREETEERRIKAPGCPVFHVFHGKSCKFHREEKAVYPCQFCSSLNVGPEEPPCSECEHAEDKRNGAKKDGTTGK